MLVYIYLRFSHDVSFSRWLSFPIRFDYHWKVEWGTLETYSFLILLYTYLENSCIELWWNLFVASYSRYLTPFSGIFHSCLPGLNWQLVSRLSIGSSRMSFALFRRIIIRTSLNKCSTIKMAQFKGKFIIHYSYNINNNRNCLTTH